eukprot:TRINITY_DN3289_c0_g1_i1.p1 TRINITY_DN3289_c0_g1~~TRINITY_DN3289_c0_g1_i1.p1  ORF type:complete len:121 (+),score=33.82 TRINITY_DN3289_c0_g1_i1:66-428(+)
MDMDNGNGLHLKRKHEQENSNDDGYSQTEQQMKKVRVEDNPQLPTAEDILVAFSEEVKQILTNLLDNIQEIDKKEDELRLILENDLKNKKAETSSLQATFMSTQEFIQQYVMSISRLGNE